MTATEPLDDINDIIHRTHQIPIGGRRAKSLGSRDGDEKWQEVPRPQGIGIKETSTSKNEGGSLRQMEENHDGK